ncbi:uncharacterized protein LOC143452550 [Clavelina lepadiformis]|uniref:uncharacterized protein LOC143452550 n=1 Tax=Clavelina lepadiformis TaxID=159417 RepID=UPI0040412676
MTAGKENTTIQKNWEMINNLIELSSMHRIIAASTSGTYCRQEGNWLNLQRRMLSLQNQILEQAFNITKWLLPALKKLQEHGDKNDLKPALVRQWSNFTCGLESFQEDLKKIFYLHVAFSDQTKPAGWEMIRTGLHVPVDACGKISGEINQLSVEPESTSTFMADSIEKVAMILQALHSHTAVQAWTIENYSSIHAEQDTSKIDLSKKLKLSESLTSLPLQGRIAVVVLILTLVAILSWKLSY